MLYGNLAEDGCIVKTAGVDESILRFTGPARIFESQDAAVDGILTGKVAAGDVVLIRYEGPRGGPGMQEMLYPTSYIKSKGLGKACALVTDGRFSGGTSGLSIGHVSPEAAEGGLIGLVEEGDRIEIDIPARRIHLAVADDVLAARRAAMERQGRQGLEAGGAQAQGLDRAQGLCGLDDERGQGRGARCREDRGVLDRRKVTRSATLQANIDSHREVTMRSRLSAGSDRTGLFFSTIAGTPLIRHSGPCSASIIIARSSI